VGAAECGSTTPWLGEGLGSRDADVKRTIGAVAVHDVDARPVRESGFVNPLPHAEYHRRPVRNRDLRLRANVLRAYRAG